MPGPASPQVGAPDQDVDRLDALLDELNELEVPTPEASERLLELGLQFIAESLEREDRITNYGWTESLRRISSLPAAQLATAEWMGLGQAFVQSFLPNARGWAFSTYFAKDPLQVRMRDLEDLNLLDKCVELLPQDCESRVHGRAVQVGRLLELNEPAIALGALVDIQESIEAGSGWAEVTHASLKCKALLALSRPGQASDVLAPFLPQTWDPAQASHDLLLQFHVECLINSHRHAAAILVIDQVLDLGWSAGRVAWLRYRKGVSLAESVFIGEANGTDPCTYLEQALSGPLKNDSKRLALLTLLELRLLDGDFDDFEARLPQLEALVAASPNSLDHLRIQRLHALREIQAQADASQLRERQQAMDPLWNKLLQEFTSVPPDPHGVPAFYSGDRADLIVTLIDLALKVEEGQAGARRALSYIVDFQMAGELVRGTGFPKPSVEQLMGQLNEGQALLVLTTGRHHSHLFAVNDRAVQHEVLPASISLQFHHDAWRRALESGLRSFERLTLDDPKISRERAAAGKLAAALLPASMQPFLADRSEIITVGMELVLPGDLAWLPLGNEPYLGTSRDTWEWPSIPAGLLILDRARAAGASPGGGGRLILGGGAEHSPAAQQTWPDLASLPLPTQLGKIASESGAFQSVATLRGQELTPESLDESFAIPSDVALFFLHAVEDDTRSSLSNRALVLSGSPKQEKGLYFSFDVANERSQQTPMIAPPFAILAACRTGSGVGRRGAGIGTDLGSAFLLAGSHATLSSVSNLLAGPAESMAAQILSGIASSQTPARALRSSRLQALEEYGPRAVFLHGRLKLVGAAGTPLFEPPQERSQPPLPVWVVGAGWLVMLLAVGFAGASLRRRA